MRICIDAHILGDRSGGNETYYRNIINNIFSYMDKDDELLIILGNENEKCKIDELNITNVSTVLFKSKSPIIRYIYEIPKIVKSYKIDILHTQYFAPLIKNCKLVVTIHDISYEHFPECFSRKELIRNKAWIKYTAKKADAILTVSNYSKHDICDKYKVDSKMVYVNHLAYSENFKKMPNEDVNIVLEKFNVKGKYILAVSNLQPRKNMVRLINAFVSLKSNIENFDYKLVLVGKKAWMHEEIFNKVKELGIKDEIVLTDYVSDLELAALYNGAEVFVYPSIFEGFGLPVLEAMACETPVIVSNTSSMPEVAGEAAVYINPYDENDIANKIQEVLFDVNKREEFIGKGTLKAKEYSWQKTAKSVMEVYRKTMKDYN